MKNHKIPPVSQGAIRGRWPFCKREGVHSVQVQTELHSGRCSVTLATMDRYCVVGLELTRRPWKASMWGSSAVFQGTMSTCWLLACLLESVVCIYIALVNDPTWYRSIVSPMVHSLQYSFTSQHVILLISSAQCYLECYYRRSNAVMWVSCVILLL